MDTADLLSIGCLGGFLLGIAAILIPWWILRRKRATQLLGELQRFFGCDPNGLAIVRRSFATVDLPNLQLAIEQLRSQTGASARVVGYASQFGEMGGNLRYLISREAQVPLAPVVERDVDIDVDRRMLAPSLVIMEDVDLIATARNEQRHPMYQITLHQLLNEMDGLANDAEVLFLLTSNRPEALETALAARPGRIDQAIEYPLPDAECRRRLIELYGGGLSLELTRRDEIVAKTEGASPAFLQELLRKASLIAAERGATDNGRLHLNDDDLDAALRELLFGGGELMQRLFGFSAQP